MNNGNGEIVLKRDYDGFLDIDGYYEELANKKGTTVLGLILDGYVSISEHKDYHSWLKINGETYYFKPSFKLYEELIAAECAKFLNIDSVTYDLAIYDKHKGVMSKSYLKNGCEYISGYDILQRYLENPENKEKLEAMGYNERIVESSRNSVDSINTLEIIWQALESHFLDNREDINKVMHKLTLIVILNILLGQCDGMAQNWEIEKSKNGIDLVAFFDGEEMLSDFDELVLYGSSLSVNFNDKNRNNYEILINFFEISSQEFIDLFMEKFNLLTVENFLEVIRLVEERIKSQIPPIDKERIIGSFINNRNKIMSIIEELSSHRIGVR